MANSTVIAQPCRALFGGQTTNATATEIFVDGISNKRLTISSQMTYTFRAMVTGRESGGSNRAIAIIQEGILLRNANASTTVLVTTVPAQRVLGDTTAGGAIAVTADTTNGSLKITVTGLTATTFNWTGRVEYDITID